jgi:hydrogenase assembly chaperone HypC/HupF
MCLGEVVQVLEIAADGAVLARAGTRTLQVSLLTLDEPVAPGDWVVVHSGFALARLSTAEALEARALRESVPDDLDLAASAPRPSRPVPMEAAP